MKEGNSEEKLEEDIDSKKEVLKEDNKSPEVNRKLRPVKKLPTKPPIHKDTHLAKNLQQYFA